MTTLHTRGAQGTIYSYRTKDGTRWAFTIDCGRYPNGKPRQISRKGFKLKGDAQEALTKQLTAIHQSAHRAIAEAKSRNGVPDISV